MLRLTTESMTNAIARAKAIRPKVKVVNADSRTYAVTGSKGDTYTVKFSVANGHKLGECSCPARTVCYHLAAAAAVNIGIQSMRRQAAAPVVSRESLISEIRTTFARKYPNRNLASTLCAEFGPYSIRNLATNLLSQFLNAIR